MRRVLLATRRRQRKLDGRSILGGVGISASSFTSSWSPRRSNSSSSCTSSGPVRQCHNGHHHRHQQHTRSTVNNLLKGNYTMRSESRLSMSTSTVASVSCWVKDVLRTKSLSPSNPILESLPLSSEDVNAVIISSTTSSNAQNNNNNNNNKQHISLLPKFSILQPHHLEKAAEEIRRQYDVELAQLEVRLTSLSEDSGDEQDGDDNYNVDDSSSSSSLSSLLLDLDRLTAPVTQLREVSELYTTLASRPDQIDDWFKAADIADSKTTRKFIENLYRSRIVYRALIAAAAGNDGTATSDTTEMTSKATTTSSFLVPFLKRGAHIDNDDDDDDDDDDDENYEDNVERVRQIQNELSILNDRLGNVVSYDRASKAMRLQCMSDMYNCIGLSRLQAQSLLSLDAVNDNTSDSDGEDSNKTKSVWELARLQHRHMVVSPKKELTEHLFPEIATFLHPFLPTQTKLNLDGVGAFLDGKSELSINSSNADAQQASLKARFDFKQRIRLHGVMSGLIDFCDAILGITVVEGTEASNGECGWSKNIRLLHLYQKVQEQDHEGDDKDDGNDHNGVYLGTIYFDPFADPYWRTEDAKELVTTRLFSQQVTGQTIAPVAIMALKITPIWDDTPVPMTWNDTRDLLHQFGKAVQLILTQSSQRRNHRDIGSSSMAMMEPAPIDTSEFMAHFMEMWIQNDGFLNRLAELSQDELVLEEETLKILRGDLKKEKALEMMNTMFLSALQFTVFDKFDPRGDETLVALQERLAIQYLPKSNLPDPSDLSPLLAVFQESDVDQNMSAYSTLWSEVLSATVYERFQKTDLRDRGEVGRLGTGIRDLFLRNNPNTNAKTNNNNHVLSRKDFEDLCGIEENAIVSGAPLKRVYQFDKIESKK